MINVAKWAVNFGGSIYSVKEGSIRTEYPLTFGKYTANDANTASVNTHTIFDLDIGHDGISFGNNKRTRLILSGGISNIFNIHYISSVTINATSERYYEPAQGRSFFINIRLAYR
jgi:outer membrane receptor protein involved in Fe transport